MPTHTALTLALLIALAVIGIGTTYLVSPRTVLGFFGLNPPAPDPDTHAWLRLKGIRDLTLGLIVLTLLATASRHTLALILLVAALVPFGDMSIILGSNGNRQKAFSVHGLTCLALLAAGLLLLHAR